MSTSRSGDEAGDVPSDVGLRDEREIELDPRFAPRHVALQSVWPSDRVVSCTCSVR